MDRTIRIVVKASSSLGYVRFYLDGQLKQMDWTRLDDKSRFKSAEKIIQGDDRIPFQLDVKGMNGITFSYTIESKTGTAWVLRSKNEKPLKITNVIYPVKGTIDFNVVVPKNPLIA